MMLPASSFCADKILARRWSLLRNHQCLNMFRMSKTEGPSSSISQMEGGGGGPRAGGEGGAGFDCLASGAAGGDRGVTDVPRATMRGGGRSRCLKTRFHLGGLGGGSEDMVVRG